MIFSFTVRAQLDPGLMIFEPRPAPSLESGIDSGRYKPAKGQPRTYTRPKPATEQVKPGLPAPQPLPVQDAPVVVTDRGPMGPPVPERLSRREKISRLKSLRLIDLEVETFFVSWNAASSSAVRAFSFQSPGLGVKTQLWLNETLGFSLGYQRTFGASLEDHVAGAPATGQSVGLDMENMAGGLTARLLSTESASKAQISVRYFKDMMVVNRAAAWRVGQISQGFELHGEVEIETTPGQAALFHFGVRPDFDHQELMRQSDVRSGSPDVSFALNAGTGYSFDLSPHHSLSARLSYHYQRDRFSGVSSFVDPGSGEPVTGAHTTQTGVYLHLGLRWGG